MLNKFSKDYYLRISDFDVNKKLRASSILDIFQDIAGAHSDMLGCGLFDMLKKDLVWIIASTKFEILSEPSIYSTVKVTTWPLPEKNLIWQREYLIELDGKIIAKGSSHWVIMKMSERKLALNAKVYPVGLEYLTDKNFGTFNRIKTNDAFIDKKAMQLLPSMLDFNGHINNIKYADLIVDRLGFCDKSIKSMQIDYHRELKVDDLVDVYVVKQDDYYIVKGDVGDKNSFMSRVELL